MFRLLPLCIIVVLLMSGCGDDDKPTAPTIPEPEPDLFGIHRTHWTHASLPVGIDTSLSERGHVSWYNPLDPVPLSEIWNREIGFGETQSTTVLRIHFKPVQYKYIDSIFMTDGDTIEVIDSTSTPIDPRRSWDGFMASYVPTLQETGLTHRYHMPEGDAALEIRMNGEFDGCMHIDIGRISEDIDGDGRLDAESLDPWRALHPEEDVGLDGVPDAFEFGYDPSRGVFDPAGDNFNGSIEDPANIWRINGTEGNADEVHGDPEGGYLPDTEDLDWNGLETLNSYFSYRIDVSDTSSPHSFYVPGTQNEYGWKTVRIPLTDGGAIDTVVGVPSWDDIRDVRIWFDSATIIGMPDTGHVIDVATFDITSTGWSSSLFIADSLLGEVGFATNFIDPALDSRYTPPPAYTPSYRLLPEVLSPDKTLGIAFHDFHADVPVYTPDSGIVLAADTGLASRSFGLNYDIIHDYLYLDAFVWGGVADGDSVICLFRFGLTDDHYVQYSTFVRPGWDPGNHIHMDLVEAFDLWRQFDQDQRQGLDSSVTRQSGRYLVRSPLDVNFSYTSFTYCAAGVINLDGTSTASGEIWLEDLRLSGLRF